MGASMGVSVAVLAGVGDGNGGEVGGLISRVGGTNGVEVSACWVGTMAVGT